MLPKEKELVLGSAAKERCYPLNAEICGAGALRHVSSSVKFNKYHTQSIFYKMIVRLVGHLP